MMAIAHSHTELARRALAGDREAGDELFRRVWPRIRSIAYAVSADHAVAEEVAQDVLETMVRRLDELRDDDRLVPWLASIAANRARNVVRHERRSAPDPEAGWDTPAPDAEGHDPEVVRAVRRLSPEHREVVALRFWADLRVADIAEVLGVPAGTVHSRLSRALSHLRTNLEVEDARP